MNKKFLSPSFNFFFFFKSLIADLQRENANLQSSSGEVVQKLQNDLNDAKDSMQKKEEELSNTKTNLNQALKLVKKKNATHFLLLLVLLHFFSSFGGGG